jgi:hypothetical protein
MTHVKTGCCTNLRSKQRSIQCCKAHQNATCFRLSTMCLFGMTQETSQHMCCWQAFSWRVTRWDALRLSMQIAECRSINHITAEGDAPETAGQLHSPHGAEPFACCFGPRLSAGQCACGHRLAADPCPAHTSNTASEQRWKLLSTPVNKRWENGLNWDECQSAAVSIGQGMYVLVHSEVLEGLTSVVLADLQQKVYLFSLQRYCPCCHSCNSLVGTQSHVSYLDLDLSISPTQAGRRITPGSA